jgi:protein SCO1/2
MKKELLRAGIGVGIFVLLLAGVVLFAPRAQNPAGQQEVGASGTALAEGESEVSGFGQAGAFMGEPIMPPRLAPDFELTDRSGKQVRMRDFRGKLVLLSFGYTSCPDVCPLLFSRFLAVQEEFKDYLGKDLILAFITVDPEVDTPQRLDEHVQATGGQWYFLTGPLPTCKEVWKAYRVHVEKEGVLVSHTALTYLIDRNGLMRVRYLGVPPAKVFIADLQEMLK